MSGRRGFSKWSVVSSRLSAVFSNPLLPSKEIIPPGVCFGGLVFLTPHILLLPNISEGVLEYWEVPSTPDNAPTHPIAALGLPALNGGYSFSMISCRGEPNPVADGMPYSTQPFHSSPMDAIVIIKLRVQGIGADVPENTFSIFVHRRALLELCSGITSSPALQPDDATDIDIDEIPWDLWGPFLTRWLEAGFIPISWITTTCGQRCVFRLTRSRDEPSGIGVLDFNPMSVKRAALGQGSRPILCIIEPGEIVHTSFQEPVISGLPCACYVLSEMFNYDGLLMDEERLIGLDVRFRLHFQSVHHDTHLCPIRLMFGATSRGSRFYILGSPVWRNELDL
jgi:hypothetical protein